MNMVQQRKVCRRVQRLTLCQKLLFDKQIFNEFVARFCELHLTALLIDSKVPGLLRNKILVHHLHFGDFLLFALFKFGNEFVHSKVQLRAVFGCSGNNQRRPRLVNED